MVIFLMHGSGVGGKGGWGLDVGDRGWWSKMPTRGEGPEMCRKIILFGVNRLNLQFNLINYY